MKKIVRVIMLVMLMISSFTTITMAANVSMSLNTDKEKIKNDEELKVIIEVKDFIREGTNNAIEAKIDYDKTKLDYSSIKWKMGWTGNISSDGTGFVGMKSEKVEQDEMVAEIIYKVKSDAEKGNTIISINKILTSSDGDEVKANNVETVIEIIDNTKINNYIICFVIVIIIVIYVAYRKYK